MILRAMRLKALSFLLVAASTVLIPGCAGDPGGAEEQASSESDVSAGRIIGLQLTPAMAVRCSRYLYASGRDTLVGLPACTRAINDVWIAVEPKVLSAPVIFPRELSVLLASEETRRFLLDLRTAVQEHKVENLWVWTLHHPVIAGDKAKAIEWLGILFHADYQSIGDVMAQFNTTQGLLLGDVYYALLGSITNKQIEVFPEGVKGTERVFYHFYTIAYLAQRLRKNGTADVYAFLAPYLLNETYERLWYYGDALLKSHASGEVARLEVEDIYLGYAGAAFALDRQGPQFRGMSLEQFTSAYASDPFDTIASGMNLFLPPNR